MKRSAGLRSPETWFLIVLLAFVGSSTARSETAKVALQYGVTYLPLSVMQQEKLWEKHSKANGVELSVEWTVLGSGGAVNDAIISGSVDIAAGGIAPMMKLWDRTRELMRVKGIAALNSTSITLIANRDDIRTLADFKPNDRISVPIQKVSYDAVIIQMAAAKLFGAKSFDRLDSQTVAMKHPDAVTALLSPRSPISAYFAVSPFREKVLKQPGMHKVIDLYEVLGGPGTFSAVWAAESFVKNKAAVYKAFIAALDEANQRIQKDKASAVDAHIKVTNTNADDRALLLGIVEDPTNVYTMTPQNTLYFADFLAQTGFLDKKPVSWKEYFFEGIHDRGGS